MTLLTRLESFLASEEAKIAQDLHPLILQLKADLAPVGGTVTAFLKQDAGVLLEAIPAALGAPTPLDAILVTAKQVLALAEKQGVTIAAQSALAIAANLHAQVAPQAPVVNQ